MVMFKLTNLCRCRYYVLQCWSVFLDLNAWLVGHHGSFFYGFIYLALILASLIFYFAACLTDPGYVDQSTLMHLVNDEVNISRSCFDDDHTTSFILPPFPFQYDILLTHCVTRII